MSRPGSGARKDGAASSLHPTRNRPGRSSDRTAADRASYAGSPEIVSDVIAVEPEPGAAAAATRAAERGTGARLRRVGNVYQLADLLTSAAYSALCAGGDADAREYVERAIPMVSGLDDRFVWMIVCGNRGLAALFIGDPEVARDAFREELELCRELVVRPIAAEGLLGLAALAAACDDPLRAARLRGPPRFTSTTSHRARSRPGSRLPSSIPRGYAAARTNGRARCARAPR